MKFNKCNIFVLVPFLVAIGCADNSNNSNNAQVTSITFVDKGSVTPSSFSTKAVIKTDSIEFSRIKSGQVIEKWTRQIDPSDFRPVQREIIDYNLLGASDVTLQPDQDSCSGWQGMTIIMEKAESTHTLEIDGSVCDRAHWPVGIREIVVLQESLIEGSNCPTYSPPAPDWCSDGSILPPLIDTNGCYGSPRCQRNVACPEYSPPAPDWCSDGTIIPPQGDQNGCYGPPTCQRNQ